MKYKWISVVLLENSGTFLKGSVLCIKSNPDWMYKVGDSVEISQKYGIFKARVIGLARECQIKAIRRPDLFEYWIVKNISREIKNQENRKVELKSLRAKQTKLFKQHYPFEEGCIEIAKTDGEMKKILNRISYLENGGL